MPAEINLTDDFGKNISRIIYENKCRYVLELGSWSGEGSTQCIIDGMNKVDGDKILQCVEIEADRYKELLKNISEVKYASAFCMNSIHKDSFLPKSFEEIWESPYNHLLEGELSFPKEMVRSWYEADIVKFNDEGFLNSVFRLPKYDAVLIDSSEFTGYSEYTLLKNDVKIFFLDDVFFAYKCNQIYCELKEDPAWELLVEDPGLRNGYAIFRRR